MTRIILYTTPYCGYCRAAKHLLTKKGATFTEIDVSGDLALRQEMIDRAYGRRTVPQIFINGTHVGGYDELAELERAAKLDPLLAAIEAVAALPENDLAFGRDPSVPAWFSSGPDAPSPPTWRWPRR